MRQLEKPDLSQRARVGSLQMNLCQQADGVAGQEALSPQLLRRPRREAAPRKP